MKIYIDGPSLEEYFLVEEVDSVVIAGDRERTRDNIRRWVARYCESRDCDGVMVYDDLEPNEVRPPVQNFGRLKVVNLPYGEEAFDEIAGKANRDAVDDKVFVVTDDRRLAGAVQRGRARLQTPEQFVRRVRKRIRADEQSMAQEPDEKFTGLSETEVDYWMEYFEEE
jgi:hypothetical protein